MKPRNFSFKQETTQSEFANLMTKQQIQNRFTHIQKQPLTRSTSRTHSLYVKQTQIQNMCIIFEKLINKSNQTKPLKQKYNFGIDFNILQQFTKLEEKQNYLIRCSVDEISKQFDRIIKKYDSTKSNIQTVDDKLDLYGWLKVKSQYKAILKRLKFALVQMIQISTTIFEKQHISGQQLVSKIKNMNSQTKLNLQDIKNQQPEVFVEWNKAIEAQFIQLKLQSKNYLLNDYETMKQQLINGAQTSKRGKILDKCEQTGNYITKEELQYIASTSFLINRNLNKEFIQRAINSLENEIKHQIELNISEQILQDYYTLKENQMKKRQQYFEEQNVIKRKQIGN